jgi:hypothetical protein
MDALGVEIMTANLQDAWEKGLPVPGSMPKNDDKPPPPPRSNSTPKSPNEKLARDGANMLLTGHSILAGMAKLFGLHGSASAIAACDEPFFDMAYDALLLDPALARSIARLGSKSGKFALIGAYATFGAAVAPIMAEEVKDKLAEIRDAMRERKAAKTIRVDLDT